MRKIFILSILFILCQFTVNAQSQKISYVFPDSVELRLNKYISNYNKKKPNKELYFLIKKDTSGVYNLTVIPISSGSDSIVVSWLKSTNRYALIDKESYPVVFDYDFALGTPTINDIGSIGQREGNVKRMELIAHRFTIYFRMNGKILKEENW